MSTVSLPALVDCHVHFREPGLEHKADMLTEAGAAHAGGIAVVCEMPNTTPPTHSIQNFADKVERSKRCAAQCDIRFFFGATKVEHLAELKKLWTDESHAALKARCSGLKLYLDHSTGDLKSDTTVVEEAFKVCAECGITVVVHCEHSETNEAAAHDIPYSDPPSHSKRRPAEAEVRSIQQAIGWARTNGTRIHIAHLSTAGGLEAVTEAKKQNMPVTCEVCPHHLFLSTNDYATLGAKVKVNPPMRTPQDRDALWRGVLNGQVDCIATDHAPHLLEEKSVTTGQPPSGIPGVEHVLRLMLTVSQGSWPHPTEPCPTPVAEWFAVEEKKGQPATALPSLTLRDIVRLMHVNPNRIFHLGLKESETRCQVDLASRLVIGKDLPIHSKCQWSPYDGWTVVGNVNML